MSVLVTAANDRLAALALAAAHAAGRGPERAAWLCAAVVLRTTSGIVAAKRELGYLDDLGRPDLTAAASDLVNQLARQEASA